MLWRWCNRHCVLPPCVPNHASRTVQLGGVEVAAQVMQRMACSLLNFMLGVPDAAQRVLAAGGGGLVVSALRADVDNKTCPSGSRAIWLPTRLKPRIASRLP